MMNSQAIKPDNSNNQNYESAEKVSSVNHTGKKKRLSKQNLQKSYNAHKTLLLEAAGKIKEPFLAKLENDREFCLLNSKNPRLLPVLKRGFKTILIRVMGETIDQNPSLFEQVSLDILNNTIDQYESRLKKKDQTIKELRKEITKQKRQFSREIKKAQEEWSEKGIELSRLKAEMENLQNKNQEVLEENRKLTLLIEQLEEELILEKAKNQLDSTNCGLPGSMDFGRKKRDQAFRNEENSQALDSRQIDGEKPLEEDSGQKQKTSEATPECPRKNKEVPNTRKKTGKRPGGQPNHPGSTLSNEDVLKLLENGAEHKIIKIGEVDEDHCKSGFIVDLKTRVVVTEVQVALNEALPEALCGGPVYGDSIEELAVLLNTEGLMGYKRMATVINELSGNQLSVSAGVLEKYLKDFYHRSYPYFEKIIEALKKSDHLATDLTHFEVGKNRHYVRNHSTPDMVAYTEAASKKVEELFKDPILKDYTGILLHDHETTHYHLKKCRHGECNIHGIRRLRKLKLIVDHSWIDQMIELLIEYDHERNLLKKEGREAFSSEKIDDFNNTFDAVIRLAQEENQTLTGKKIKKHERTLINSLVKYRTEHTRFLYDFKLDFTNNISERDLRVVVRKRKMIGCFRTEKGLERYCEILSIVETAKKQNIPVLSAIDQILRQTSSFWPLS